MFTFYINLYVILNRLPKHWMPQKSIFIRATWIFFVRLYHIRYGLFITECFGSILVSYWNALLDNGSILYQIKYRIKSVLVIRDTKFLENLVSSTRPFVCGRYELSTGTSTYLSPLIISSSLEFAMTFWRTYFILTILIRAHMSNDNPCSTQFDTKSKFGPSGPPVVNSSYIVVWPELYITSYLTTRYFICNQKRLVIYAVSSGASFRHS